MQVDSLSKIVIATRESRLALWQAEHVQALLQQLFARALSPLGGRKAMAIQQFGRRLPAAVFELKADHFPFLRMASYHSGAAGCRRAREQKIIGQGGGGRLDASRLDAKRF